MGALIIFIFISVLVISALLFFNKGKKAEEIKSILKDIYENFNELFSNLKKLFLILSEIIQEKSDKETTQLEDESSSDDSTESASSNVSKSRPSKDKELETPSEDSINDKNDSSPEIVPEPVIISSVEDAPFEDSSDSEDTDKNNQ